MLRSQPRPPPVANGRNIAVRTFRDGAAIAIIVATLFAIDYFSARSRDQTRIQHVAQIKDAIENFHKTRGGYPTELRSALVDGGFLKEIPTDPVWGHNGEGLPILFGRKE